MKKQNFIITSLFLFWVIGTTTAQTITGKVTNIHAQAQALNINSMIMLISI